MALQASWERSSGMLYVCTVVASGILYIRTVVGALYSGLYSSWMA